jgi:hypothetical protein
MKYDLSRIGTVIEIAAELGLTYGRSAQLTRISGFPEHIWVIGNRNKVWDLDAVKAWHDERRNAPVLRRKEQVKMMLEALHEELEWLGEPTTNN